MYLQNVKTHVFGIQSGNGFHKNLGDLTLKGADGGGWVGVLDNLENSFLKALQRIISAFMNEECLSVSYQSFYIECASFSHRNT